ncbi:hypothetical protein LUZ60_005754 [Juncus effusus]|nr:hypothetical protein LUZ60_005754 [Juncus effusus]
MAMKQTFTLCLLSFLALILTINGADVASPAPSVDCSSVILSMADCLTFVENGSTIAIPEKTCCDGLKIVLKQNPICLCETFKNSADFGIVLDMKKALTLPKACHVKTPPFSECNITLPGVTSPATSPATSPVSSGTPPSSGDNTALPPTGSVSTDSSASAPPPSKSMAAQINTHLFTLVAIFASIMVIYCNYI